jgi:hypothetical protein
MSEYVVRFLVGGVVVSAFAILGDLLRPKSFAGLFGAAPSVALATLGIAVYRHGIAYAAQQTWAMTAGAIALAMALLQATSPCRLAEILRHYYAPRMSSKARSERLIVEASDGNRVSSILSNC